MTIRTLTQRTMTTAVLSMQPVRKTKPTLPPYFHRGDVVDCCLLLVTTTVVTTMVISVVCVATNKNYDQLAMNKQSGNQQTRNCHVIMIAVLMVLVIVVTISVGVIVVGRVMPVVAIVVLIVC